MKKGLLLHFWVCPIGSCCGKSKITQTLNPNSNLTQVWSAVGPPPASLALGGVAAFAGPGATPGAEAGFLCHASAGGGTSGSASAASYSLPGTAGTSRTPWPHVPPVALPGRPGLLLLHVQADVSSELDGLERQRLKLVNKSYFSTLNPRNSEASESVCPTAAASSILKMQTGSEQRKVAAYGQKRGKLRYPVAEDLLYGFRVVKHHETKVW